MTDQNDIPGATRHFWLYLTWQLAKLAAEASGWLFIAWMVWTLPW